SHFVGNLLLYLGRETDRAAAGGRLLLGCRLGIGIGLCCRSGFVCRLQIGSQQIVGDPESWRGVNRSRGKVIAIISIPRSRTPTPAKRYRRGPGIIGPAIESGGIVHARNKAVVGMPVPVITAIGICVTTATIVIGSPHIGAATPVVAMFGIATAVAIANHSDTGPGMGVKPPLAMSAVVDGHAVAGMYSAYMAAVTEIRSRAILSLNTRPLTTGVEIVGAAVRAGLGSASVSGSRGAVRSIAGGPVRPAGGWSVRAASPAGGRSVRAASPAGGRSVRGFAGGPVRPAAGRAGLSSGRGIRVLGVGMGCPARRSVGRRFGCRRRLGR